MNTFNQIVGGDRSVIANNSASHAFPVWNLSESSYLELRPRSTVCGDDSGLYFVDDERIIKLEPGLILDITRNLIEPVRLAALYELFREVPKSQILFALHHLGKNRMIAIYPEVPTSVTRFNAAMEPNRGHSELVAPGGVYVTNISGLSDGDLRRSIERYSWHLLKIASTDCPNVVLTDSYYSELTEIEVLKLLEELKPACPAKIFGTDLWVGPIFIPGELELARKFFNRIRSNSYAQGLNNAEGFPTLAERQALSTDWSTDVGLAMLLSLLSKHTQIDDCEVRRNCLTFNFGSLETRYHSIEYLLPERESVLPVSRSTRNRDGGARIESPTDFIKRMKPHLSPITGLVPDLFHVGEGGPLYVCHTSHGTRTPILQKINRSLGRRFGAAGKGESEQQAIASCIGEALERYSAGYQEGDVHVYCTLSEASCEFETLDPRRLNQFSAEQLSEKKTKPQTGFNVVPVAYRETDSIGWMKGSNLSRDTECLVPAAFVLFQYFADDRTRERRYYYADSNGCASGATIEESSLQGLYEVIERDACGIWWYNQVSRPPITTELRSSFVDACRKHFEKLGRGLLLLDLTNDLKVPVVCALSYNLSSGKEICFGLGCNLSKTVAVSRAIAELNQFVATLEPCNMDPKFSLAPEIEDWLRTANIHEHKYLWPDDAAKHIDPIAPEYCEFESPKQELEFLVSRLTQMGFEVYRACLTRPETRMHACKMIVPELRHFWPRFSQGRLFDVPVKLGWIQIPLAESELNPIGFFL